MSPRARALLCALTLIAGIAGHTGLLTPHAHAQRPRGRAARLERPYIAPKLMIGAAGSVDVEADGQSATSARDDLELTYGAGVAYIVPFARYLALGGQLGIESWSGSTQYARGGVLADLSLIVQGNLTLSTRLEIFLSIPVGLGVDLAPDDPEPATVPTIGAVVHAQTVASMGRGYHIGAFAGFRAALSRHIGFLFEAGLLLHHLSYALDGQITTDDGSAPTPLRGSFRADLVQPRVSVGMYF